MRSSECVDENTKILIDNSVLFRRMSIVEIYNLLIALPEKGNKSLYVIQLTRLDETDVSPANSTSASQTNTSVTHSSVTPSSSLKDQMANSHNNVQGRSHSVPAQVVQSLAQSGSGNQPSTPPITCTQMQYVYRLPRDKASLKGCKLERTKGCSTYALSKPFSSPLRLLVAIGKRLLLFIWKSTIMNASSLSQWNQFQESNVESTFHFVRVRFIFHGKIIMNTKCGELKTPWVVVYASTCTYIYSPRHNGNKLMVNKHFTGYHI